MPPILTDEDRKLAAATREFKQRWREGNTDTTPIPQQESIQKPPIDPLDKIESQIAQQLRIQNLMKMLKELGSPEHTQTEKKSELEMFKDFTEIQNTLTKSRDEAEERLRKKILEDITEGEAEPQSGTDYLLKVVGEKILSGEIDIRKQEKAPQSGLQEQGLTPQQVIGQNIPSSPSNSPAGNPAGVGKAQTDKEIIASLPNYLITAIKSGELEFDAIYGAMAREKGQDLTPQEGEQIERIYNKIKAVKKVGRPKK